MGCAPCSAAQHPAITGFGADGTLTWTNAPTAQTATVETRSAATTGQWAAVQAEPATGRVASARVDMAPPRAWFRVANTPSNDVPPDLVLVPGGVNNGSNPLAAGESPDPCAYPETYALSVDAFYIGRHEVTKAAWDEVALWAAGNGYDLVAASGTGKGPDHPVQDVTWYECVKWCNARSEMEDRAPAYYTSAERTAVYRTGWVDVPDEWVRWDTGYRLPTSEEWEYAGRGGAGGRRFPWAGDSIGRGEANYSSYWSGGAPYYPYDTAAESGYHPVYATGERPYTSPVGTFAANAYGLYDMAGNVFEWCNDWHPCFDGTGRVIRGGAWNYNAWHCRVGSRGFNGPGNSGSMGFRVVLAPGP